MEILANPRFSAMLLCLGFTIFSITLNGHLRKDMGDALFGFLGLVWLGIVVSVFVVFGWKIGFLCVAGSYLFSMIVSPLSELIASFLRGDFTRD
jgi:hypothetical protein